MSCDTPSDQDTPCSSTKCNSNNINGNLDSSFRSEPSHRGSLTPSELDTIHQTSSFKQAKLLEEKDNRKIAIKTKDAIQAEKSNE